MHQLQAIGQGIIMGDNVDNLGALEGALAYVRRLPLKQGNGLQNFWKDREVNMTCSYCSLVVCLLTSEALLVTAVMRVEPSSRNSTGKMATTCAIRI